MSVSMSKSVASLVLSGLANQLAHNALGVRGRRLARGFAVVATLSGAASGVAGLGNFIGKTGVATLGLTAGLSAACAALALTMLKSEVHLRIAGEYESLFVRTVCLDETTPDDDKYVQDLRREFEGIGKATYDRGVAVSNGQVRKYERRARAILAHSTDPLSANRAEIIES